MKIVGCLCLTTGALFVFLAVYFVWLCHELKGQGLMPLGEVLLWSIAASFLLFAGLFLRWGWRLVRKKKTPPEE